jgi:hypothetical protein
MALFSLSKLSKSQKDEKKRSVSGYMLEFINLENDNEWIKI